MSADEDPLVDPRDTTRTEAPENLAPHARVPVKIEEALGALAMALIVVISFGNVLARYFTNVSFAFTEEFSIFLLVFMTFVGASAAFATNEHIRIGFFLGLMGPRTRLLAEAVTLLATTAMFALIVYYGAQVTFDEWYWGETSPGLGYPAWIYTIWLPLLSLAILGRVIGRAVASVRGRAR
ncbi:TRAP transporter small permease [Salinarimonas chemoclinalis]|uniref:TRAP transporter small permease n=1 Tax=Salinarimonas chemoclinalis TaxID=3241599 RepID=UPI003558CA6F